MANFSSQVRSVCLSVVCAFWCMPKLFRYFIRVVWLDAILPLIFRVHKHARPHVSAARKRNCRWRRFADLVTPSRLAVRVEHERGRLLHFRFALRNWTHTLRCKCFQNRYAWFNLIRNSRVLIEVCFGTWKRLHASRKQEGSMYQEWRGQWNYSAYEHV